MENALKALMLAAGVVITCTIIAFGFYAADLAKKDANSKVDSLTAYETRLYETNYYAYDGATLSGSELLNLIRYEMNKNYENKNISCFEIVGDKSYRISKLSDLGSLTAADNPDRIMPYKAYLGETVWQNNCLTGLRFTEIKNN